MVTTPQVRDRIRKEILESGRDRRYGLEAYAFVLSGMEFCRAKTGERRHVTGRELSHALAEFAAKQFGPMSWHVLQSWGISTTDDFGYIVYNMIDIQILRKQESDNLKDFFGVLDLPGYYSRQGCYTIDRRRIRDIEGA
ncbi:MAG: hypothetical protein GF418_14575 [Chitinivibrionales bacterium]|nr:hypothetical protein [Chitinivibrionales bacterium]MBD3396846.1 hypothetical protein [Chitinivibrionales bacterium]